MNEFPKISVVIPTRNRPALVSRAVMSALSQTFRSIEIVVVIDGPDDETIKTLDQIKDPRLSVLALQKNVGGSDARNAGVRSARSEWIAFLDDDDEWTPEKLARQFDVAIRLRNPFPVIFCRFIARTPNGFFVWPRRLPRPSEPISEYLFVRNSFFQGEGYLQTSTLLVKKRLLEIVPFRSGLKKHQDWDWILRVAPLDGVSIEVVPEALAFWYVQEPRISISSKNMWRYSLEWLQENRQLVTPKAYAGFVATQIVPQAANQGEWKEFTPLLREMFHFGKPRIIDFVQFIGMWCIPQRLRRTIRDVFRKKSDS
jgi:glycosyltransferase involved in cell wall biosynthesis